MANQPKHEFWSVKHCARCGQDHDSVEFQAFRGSAVEDEDGTRWEWWGTCPVTGDPILGKQDNPTQSGKPVVLGGSERKHA